MNKTYSQKQKDRSQAIHQERMLNISYNLHEIEGNPLLPIEKAMFEYFAKKSLSNEECREFIRKIAIKDSTSTIPF
jgi:hypothetical protein